MIEQSSRLLKVGLSVLFIVLLAVLAFVILWENGLLGKKVLNPQPTVTTSQPQSEIVPPPVPEKEFQKVEFVTIKSNTVEGIVTEIISPESLVRIYDPERKVVYGVIVPPNTLLALKGDNSISIGDRIRAVSTTSQDAFEFHADSVTIVSNQADQFPIPPSVQKIPLP